MVIPHAFPSVVAGNNPPLLIVGAGLSLEEIDLSKILDGLSLAGVVACANSEPCFKRPEEQPHQCPYCAAEAKLAELEQSPSSGEHSRFSLTENGRLLLRGARYDIGKRLNNGIHGRGNTLLRTWRRRATMMPVPTSPSLVTARNRKGFTRLEQASRL